MSSENHITAREVLLTAQGPDEPTAGLLKNLRENKLVIPDRPIHPDDMVISGEYEAIKREVYALVAYILEQVHSSVEAAALKDIDSRYAQIDVEEITDEMFFVHIGELEYPYSNAFYTVLYKWWEKADGYDLKVIQRFEDLLCESDIGSRGWGLLKRDVAKSFIQRGANTAGSVVWGVYRAVPVAFYQKYGRVISPEEYRDIVKTATPLIITLASMHLSNFSNLMSIVQSGNDISQALKLEFPLELFTLVEDSNGKTALSFDQSAIQTYKLHMSSRGGNPEERFGCPARDARVLGTGKPTSMIHALCAMYGDVAERHLLPHVERYVQGALKIATAP